ncbi:hypothetical protein AQPW35_49110 [Rubrivivax pictus]|uniref:Uncharacterized protein n=1 Tax=Pseudaquabacterium pictum TaxID=2315236 RepID=A0A480AXZ5_9BURK|nr:hypothetical protein AQPW35_49110 [Rubrivivax pictus]
MVQPFRELVHVEQHGPQHREVGRLAAALGLGHQQVHRPQHGRQGLVFVTDHVEGKVAHGGSGVGRMPAAWTARPLPALRKINRWRPAGGHRPGDGRVVAAR